MEYLKITQNPLSTFSKYHHHVHSVCEVYYFVAGDADYLVDEKEYHLSPHSLMLLAPNVLHGIRVNSDADYIRYCLYFSPEDIIAERRSLLLSAFPMKSGNENQIVYYENLEEYHIEDFFQYFQYLETLSDAMRAQYYPVFLEAFLARIHILLQTRYPSSAGSSSSPVAADIIKYLNQNIAEPHTLDSLSKRFHISKYYMSRVFRKNTGTTIIDYLISKRVALARQYIMDGESSTGAAAKAGFSDYSTFYRAYKRIFGMPPSDTPKNIH